MKTTATVVLLLVASNTFMTLAWYGHLKYKSSALWVVILASWVIALPEYALQVPANRAGHGTFSATQLKVIQEAVSLAVFAVCAAIYFREMPTWRTGLAFVLILGAVALVGGKNGNGEPPPAAASAPDRPVPAEGVDHPADVVR
jgi:uncharacterized protein (DUF486 family)